MRIVITGGSGFIGTVLARQLLTSGHDIRIYDKVASSSYPDHTFIGDVRDEARLKQTTEAADLVIHLAAEHADDVSPISLYYDVNVGGARNVVAACRANDVRTIVFTSTVAVYGLNVGIKLETSPIEPFNDYGLSKWEAEEIFRSWQASSDKNALTILRPSVVFGEGNRGNVYNLIRLINHGRFVMVGPGDNRKSMAYVENVASFLTSRVGTSSVLEVFNYADSPDLSTNELVKIIRGELGRRGTGVRLPYRAGMAAGYFLDTVSAITGKRFPISAIRIRKFNADTRVGSERALATGFRPEFTVVEGLQRMVKSEFGLGKRRTTNIRRDAI